MTFLEELEMRINCVIQDMLLDYTSTDYPRGLELHGELRDKLRHKDSPETTNGVVFKIGPGHVFFKDVLNPEKRKAFEQRCQEFREREPEV